MRTTLAIGFYCRSSKANRYGESPIEMSLCLSGRRVFLNLPRKCTPREFENPDPDLEAYLSAMRVLVNRALTEFAVSGTPATADTLREYIRTGGVKSHTVGALFGEYLSLLEKRVGKDLSLGVYKKYLRIRDLFFGVVDSGMEAASVRPSDITRFQNKILNYRASTKAAMLTKLKTFFLYGQNNGYFQNQPFQMKIHKPAPEIVYLNASEFHRLVHTPIENGRLSKVRDIAVFQASTGLSYVDMVHLSTEDLKVSQNGSFYLKGRRQKTGTEFVAPILPEGLEVLRRYGRFPNIISNQRYNCYLKELADLCHIEKTLTTHTMRRTYASRLLNSGVRAEVVAKALGHIKPDITLKHYARLEDEAVVREIVPSGDKMRPFEGKSARAGITTAS